MDIYFCDECCARITDLDLRAGKGMRRRHDNICGECVDRGLAKQWLGSTSFSAAKVQHANASPAPVSASAVALAEPDPISVARDRARTAPDDPIGVEEPILVKPAKAPDNESLARPGPQATTAEAQPIDGLSDAAGGFGALVGSAAPHSPRGLVDDPADFDAPGHAAAQADAGESTPEAPADSPFDFAQPQDNENPGKAETSAVDAIKPSPGKPEKVAIGRQTAEKRGASSTSTSTSTIVRRNVKPVSTRRANRQGGNKKIMILSLVSCAVMVVVFFGFVYPNVNKPRKPAEVIRDEPLVGFKDTINAARTAAGAGMQSDDMATVQKGIDAIRAMQSSFLEFQRKAGSAWNDDAHGEQLRVMGYYDVMTMLKPLNDRKGIIKQRN